MSLRCLIIPAALICLINAQVTLVPYRGSVVPSYAKIV